MLFCKRREKSGASRSKSVPGLRAVPSDKWLSEYRGSVSAGARTSYALFTVKINAKDRAALLAEGFKGVGAIAYPSHVIYCTHQLFFDSGRTRLLFNVVLSLDSFVAPAQDKAALEITQILKRQLELCKEPRFVIRKRTKLEFPWSQEDGELDQYWLTNAGVAYRSVLRKFAALGLVNEDVTEIQ